MSEKSPKGLNDNPLFWLVTCLGVVSMALAAWLLDLKWLYDRVQPLNGFVVFLLMALLPIVGVPASILYVVGGAKFGHTWGLVIAGAAIVIHLLASWWVAHSWLKRPLEMLLRKLRRQKPQVPEGEYVAVCLLVSLMPGASYALKNYLLVLAGVPFRQFFWTCLPIHLVTASLGIFFGGFTGSMTKPRIIFLIAYAAFLFGLSRYVFRRLKRRKLKVAAEQNCVEHSQVTPS